jgi:hypothetical protein
MSIDNGVTAEYRGVYFGKAQTVKEIAQIPQNLRTQFDVS